MYASAVENLEDVQDEAPLPAGVGAGVQREQPRAGLGTGRALQRGAPLALPHGNLPLPLQNLPALPRVPQVGVSVCRCVFSSAAQQLFPAVPA